MLRATQAAYRTVLRLTTSFNDHLHGMVVAQKELASVFNELAMHQVSEHWFHAVLFVVLTCGWMRVMVDGRCSCVVMCAFALCVRMCMHVHVCACVCLFDCLYVCVCVLCVVCVCV